MKKKFFTLICICMLVGASMLMFGCGAPALSRPSDLRIEETTLMLSWREIKTARYYTLQIDNGSNAEEKNVRGTSYSLVDLPEGNYEIRVKAVANGKDNSDSAWSKSIRFTREAEPGFTFTLIDNNTAFEVSGLGRASGNVVIPDTYRGKPVTKIGAKAFQNKTNLTGVTFGKNITEIGERAFYKCSYLTSVTLPAGLKKIGADAFQSCRSLSGKLVIPDGVESIEAGTFSYCLTLSELDLGNGVKTIGEHAFSDMSQLQSLTIHDGLEEIGDYAFANCKRLKSVVLGKNVVRIGEGAFGVCSALTDVTFDEKLTEIGKQAFIDCDKLTAVKIPDGVTKIGQQAFVRCRQLADVQLGSGLTRIEQDAFFDTVVWNEAEDRVYLGNWFLGVKNIEVAAVDVREGTVGIANYALAQCTKIANIVLPDSVKYVGDGAFYGCTLMGSAVLGAGCEEVGAYAFYRCAKLTNAILGSYNFNTQTIRESSMKFIGRYAFMECTQLNKITIPSSVTNIDSYAFNKSGLWTSASDGIVYADNWLVGADTERMTANSTVEVRAGTVGIANHTFMQNLKLKSVTMPDSVRYIGRNAFYACTSLTDVELSQSVETIEDYTFYRCTQLQCVALPQSLKKIGRSAFYACGLGFGKDESEDNVLIIPDSVTEIGDFAFYGCGEVSIDMETWQQVTRGVDIVKIGTGVTRIGAHTFYGFSSLKRVELGVSVTEIGEKAFYRCDNLQEVLLNDELYSVGARAFYECKSLTEITIPGSVREIGDRAFYKCERLVSLDLGDGVQKIGDYAFYGCVSLASLHLPTSLGFLGNQAFRNCKALQSVVIDTSLPNIGAHAFYGCSELTVYTSFAAAPQGWDARWNSSYRPVVWGCKLDYDFAPRFAYITGIDKTANSVSNRNTSNTVMPPEREGYTFAGWTTTVDGKESQYSAENMADAPDGKLYAVWTKNEQ